MTDVPSPKVADDPPKALPTRPPIRLGSARPRIWGIVNVTPDSFSDGGQFEGPDSAVAQALQMRRDGAAVLDVGGESTRPGAAAVSPEEEMRRVVPVIEGLRGAGDTGDISIDTRRADVAQAALRAGATIVNDVSAGGDPAMFATVAHAGAGMVVMHMQGTPQTMQERPTYEDVVVEVRRYLHGRSQAARAAGLTRLWLDPGIGFGKTTSHNLALVRMLPGWATYGSQILLGVSRKSFLGKLTGTDQANERLGASLACVSWAVSAGADVRVHDVRQTHDFLAVVEALRKKRARH